MSNTKTINGLTKEEIRKELTLRMFIAIAEVLEITPAEARKNEPAQWSVPHEVGSLMITLGLEEPYSPTEKEDKL